MSSKPLKLRKLTIREKPSDAQRERVLKERPATKIKAGLKDAMSIVKGEADPSTYRTHVRPKPKMKLKPEQVKLKPKALVRAEEAEKRQKEIDRRTKARKAYQAKAGVVLDTCLDNLDQLEEFAKVQVVTLPDGKSREWPVISVTALAAPLNTTAVTTNRWVATGMLPKPILKTGRGQCYHIEEVRSFLEIIGEHQTEMKQYRASHTEVRERLFRENARIRKSILNLAV